ncbi:autophagy protein [Nowakowskiella sp. JEL0407]|nr:autophagy protein [Nowakowskiella sp. JEL0407]
MSVESLSFNQDFSCVSVGNHQGYKIYNCMPWGKCLEKQSGGMKIVAMLFCTSLVALVELSNQRTLVLLNTKRQTTICQLNFSSNILAVKLNRKRLVVLLDDFLYIYDIGNMALLHTIDIVAGFPSIALSPNEENSLLIYPSPSLSTGDLTILDTISLESLAVIHAHKSHIVAVECNSNGNLVASASDKGTIIRVFSTHTFQKLFEFRRGSLPARIYSLAFNAASSLLTCSSDSDTVHIFSLATFTSDQNPDSLDGTVVTSNPQSSGNNLKKISRIASKSTKILAGLILPVVPDRISNILEPQRDFAWAKIPYNSALQSVNSGSSEKRKRTVCGFVSSDLHDGGIKSEFLMVVGEDGVYLYNLDGRGGELELVKMYGLDEGEEAA